MVQDGSRRAAAVIRDLLLQQREIARFFEVGAESEDQPESAVTIWLFIHGIPAAHGQAGGKLMAQSLQQNGAGACRVERRNAKTVLHDVAVAIPAPAAPAATIAG